jgi:hypothetical protein
MTGLFCESCHEDLKSTNDYKTVIVDGKPMRIGIECCGGEFE